MGKNAIYDRELVCKIGGKIFTLKFVVLKMITNYHSNTPDSLDAKLIIKFMDEWGFDKRARSKNMGHRNALKNFCKKNLSLHVGKLT